MRRTKRSLGAFVLVASSCAALAVSFAGCSPFASADEPAATEAAAPEDASTPDTSPTVDAAKPATNPYGALYPTRALGFKPRDAMTLGLVLPNLTFPGYGKGNALASTIQMADVYDPEARTHDIVVILLEGLGGPPAREMMDMLAMKPPGRAAFVVLLDDGSVRGSPATLPELDGWRTTTKVVAWYGLDLKFKQVSTLNENILPSAIVLDARTMEIISVAAGYDPMLVAHLDAARAEVLARPRSY